MTAFADLGLSPALLDAVTEAGYTTPTPIQAQAIPYVLMGRDVLGCAQTGTGKTAGFTLPMIDILASGRARARMPRTLILEPTRELAAQVAVAFETYGKNNKLTMALVIGGESMSDQERKLDRGVDVLIATPGRLLDLFERGKILLSDIKILVIDEADRMLDMGFIPDIERIVAMLPKTRQTLFFSATMPPEIRRLADAFLSNPKEITVAPPASTAVNVAQHVVMLHDEEKRRALRTLIELEDVKNAIIFSNRKRDVDILFKSLQRHGFDVVSLHGDMVQAKRTETLEKFRSGQVRLLVASDVAARGIDIQGLSHVFNFDVPIHAEDYVHRIGRTGRAANLGRAFMFATPDDGKLFAAITKLIGKDIPFMTLDGFEHPEFDPEGGKRGRGRRAPARTAKPASRRNAPEPLEEAVAAAPVEIERAPETAAPRRRNAGRKPYRDRDAPTAEPIRMGTGTGSNVTPFEPGRGGSHRRDRDQDDDDERIIGFGDHQPAFLLRPVRIASRS
ncbi:MAG TPA: DEAD/DEAH box helicase [Aliidongia sp.]|nr:DEAD/DEAH box helicase [Aliidongia sp.]